MNRYESLLFLHVVFVIVWLGAGTTISLIGLYAVQTGDTELRARLPRLGMWLGPRVFGPSALGTLVFGVALVHDGHWGFGRLWIDLGFAAVVVSLVLGTGIRVPLARRAQSGSRAAGGVLRRLPVFELAVLYVTVADMIAKPVGSDTGTLATGGAILALAAAFVLVSPRKGTAWQSSS